MTTAFAALCATAAEYDVTRYGARPDGKSDNTAATQKAIDDCAAKFHHRIWSKNPKGLSRGLL